MIRSSAIVLVASMLAACQSGTRVVIEQPAEQIATKVREHFAAVAEQKQRPGFEFTHLKMETAGGNTRVSFLEDYDKSWAIKTQITIEPRGQTATLIMIDCNQVEAGVFTSEHIRRTEIEGHRMAEILRILDVQPLKPTRWRD